MRSDLNLVTNNVYLVSYDVKEVKSKVNALGSQMTEQQSKTKYLEKEVNKTDMKVNVGIALGVVCCATSIGAAGKASSFAQKGVEAAVKAGCRELANTVIKVSDIGANVVEDIAGKLTEELSYIGADPFFGDMVSVPIQRSLLRSTATTDKDKLNAIIEWCDKEYAPVNEINFTDELDDQSKVALTSTSIDMSKRFRHTMKPMIKTLVIATEKSILSTDFVRGDTIDVVGKLIEGKIHLEAEEIIRI